MGGVGRRADFAGQADRRDRGGGAPGKDARADKAEPCGESKEKQSDSKESNMRSRITFHNPNGDFGIEGIDITKLDKPLYAAVAKLEHYEDTGLSPDDVDLLKDMYDGLVEELDRRPRKWINVRDKMPEDGENVLVCVSGKPKTNITLDHSYEFGAYIEDEGWIIESYPEWEDPTVTHWMPPPEPPEDLT